MEHSGIDVHKAQSQICIRAEGGALIERRIQTERGRFAAVLGNRGRARILIEASTARVDRIVRKKPEGAVPAVRGAAESCARYRVGGSA